MDLSTSELLSTESLEANDESPTVTTFDDSSIDRFMVPPRLLHVHKKLEKLDDNNDDESIANLQSMALPQMTGQIRDIEKARLQRLCASRLGNAHPSPPLPPAQPAQPGSSVGANMWPWLLQRALELARDEGREQFRLHALIRNLGGVPLAAEETDVSAASFGAAAFDTAASSEASPADAASGAAPSSAAASGAAASGVADSSDGVSNADAKTADHPPLPQCFKSAPPRTAPAASLTSSLVPKSPTPPSSAACMVGRPSETGAFSSGGIAVGTMDSVRPAASPDGGTTQKTGGVNIRIVSGSNLPIRTSPGTKFTMKPLQFKSPGRSG